MKKTLAIFIAAMQCVMATTAMAAVSIKKAAPVETKQADKLSSATSLLPTVINLVGTVQQLKAQQKALTDECVPTTAEINFVDKMMKEWAKTGEMSADQVMSQLGRSRCEDANGYAARVRSYAGTGVDDALCFNYFSGAGNSGMIWENYPKVGIVTDLCSDGTTVCRDKETKSDIYDIFNLITFTQDDYVGKDEITMAGKLMDKIEKCSYSKLSARKKEMWGEFLTTTMGTIGQKQNTGNIMQMVSGITSSGGGGLSGLGSIATQFLGNN